MDTVQNRLRAILEKWNLLKHPFYTEWSHGTLPAEKLTAYSGEYASFIGKIAPLWEACGENAIAAHERQHFELWKRFASGLGAKSFDASNDATRRLLRHIDASVVSHAPSLGTLYAFEAQQPYTAQSKLLGLRTHYSKLNADTEYFEVHKDDFEEPKLLLEKIERLPAEEQQRCVEACDETGRLLWDTLTEINSTM